MSGPETTNGTRWEVQLSATPPPAWLEFFKQAGGASASSATAPRPQRVTVDRASIVFKSDEDHVEQWIEAGEVPTTEGQPHGQARAGSETPGTQTMKKVRAAASRATSVRSAS